MTAPTPLAHTRPERPPLRTAATALLVSAALAALLCAGAVALAPESIRTPLTWGAAAAAVVLCAAVTAAAHWAATARLLRQHTAALGAENAHLQQERVRIGQDFQRERERATAEFTEQRAALTAANARLTEEARTAVSERAAALAACANAAGRMQALATGMLADLRDMEGRHADEDVLADLLHLDHRTAQAGRLADSVAVLTGARSGRRWARPIAMESILRGALGRISGYQRVRTHSTSEVAIAGHAAEGVMHALAELLDNAANFSPPTSEVHVYVEEVPAGVIVSVEDSGLVMGDVQLRRAERAVSGEGTGLTGLSGTRLGLAVVGRLARKHGLTVSFRPSARGGTGVLLLVPQELLSRPSEERPADAADDERPVAMSATPASAALAAGTPGPGLDPVPTHESAAAPDHATAARGPEDTQNTPQLSPGGLPRRRRGRTLAAAERARTDSAPRAADAPRPSAATRFGGFHQAVRSSSATPATGTPLPAAATEPTAAPAPTAPPAGPREESPATPSHPEGDTPR